MPMDRHLSARRKYPSKFCIALEQLREVMKELLATLSQFEILVLRAILFAILVIDLWHHWSR
jgi:hypothetical protein